MRSANERMELLKIRADELERKRCAVKYRVTVISCCAACAGIIAAMSAFAAFYMQQGSFQNPVANTASIFTDSKFFGYTAVGILSFLLGVSITLLCSLLHKKSKEEHGNDGIDG